MLEHGILQSRYFVSLEEAIDCVRQPEILNGPTKDSKRHGITTYREIRDMMNSPEDSKKLANDFNRDADLDKLKDYENKLKHSIRYESGVSDKSEIAVSVLKNMPEDTPAQIRDSGTMISLICGEYFEERIITGNRWLDRFGRPHFFRTLFSFPVLRTKGMFATLHCPFVSSIL